MADIHWFPGHMKKALIEIENRAKVVDLIIEVLDSRAPYSSRNKYLEIATKNKDRLIILTKADLCDKKSLESAENYYKSQGFLCISVNLNDQNDIKKIIKLLSGFTSKRNEKFVAKGMKPQPIRAMIVGIPNVGKSTLINKLAKRRAASVANTPGHTKSQQWIRVTDTFELLDTPGILQSDYEDKNIAISLALIGSIKETILPNDFLANILIDYLLTNYKDEFFTFYSIEGASTHEEILLSIAKRRNLVNKGEYDLDKARILLLNEFKKGTIVKCPIEKK